MEIVRCDNEGLERTAAALLGGGVAVIPTDTVYGLAAHPLFSGAVERLYTIKARQSAKPIAMLASGVEAVERAGFNLPVGARVLAERHWPGALTLVVPSQDGLRTEGFRVPDHPWTRRLLELCGGLLRVTSANMSGERPATDAPSALAEVGLAADIVADDGTSPGGLASTVVRVFPSGGVEVLRQGTVKV